MSIFVNKAVGSQNTHVYSQLFRSKTCGHPGVVTCHTYWNILSQAVLLNGACMPVKHADTVRLSVTPFYPSALRAGGVLSSRFGRAGGSQTCGTHISVTAWRIFSIWSSVELSRPIVVHCHGHLPIGPKTCQICHKLGPDFAERISLKLLDGFTPFKVSWTCLDL